MYKASRTKIDFSAVSEWSKHHLNGRELYQCLGNLKVKLRHKYYLRCTQGEHSMYLAKASNNH